MTKSTQNSSRQAADSTRKLLRAQVSNTALTGVGIAVVMVIFASVLAGYFQYGNVSINSVIEAQSNNFVLWILDVVPFVFAFLGQRINSNVTKQVDAIVADRLEVLRDQAKAMEQQAAYDSTHDPLTDLPNRIAFAGVLTQEISKAKARADKLALLTLSIDRFKEINGSLGHTVGDRVLQQMAERLLSVALYPMSVARTGGDEFSIIAPGIDNRNSVKALSDKLLASLNAPYRGGEFPVSIQVSIGAALYPRQSDDPEVLKLYAELAMRSAKNDLTRFVFFHDSMAKADTRQLEMISELRKALQNDELSLSFQPKVDTKTRRFISTEVLARWFHLELGQVSPAEFIPLAERAGLINELTYWVIDEALRQCAQWREENGQEIGVAVNLSAHTLIDPELPNRISAYLTKHGVSASSLSFEISETSIMADAASSMHILQTLIDLGVTFAIDHFGTGYSSLIYLKQLPASEIKIHQSFVNNMLADSDDAMIVRSTIQLAQNFGFKVIAEGVEHEAVAEQLQQWGCDMLQGYHISKPLAPRELTTWLQRERLLRA